MGAGKTRAGCVEALRMPKNTTGAVVAPTYPMLKDATLATFLELTKRAGILRKYNVQDKVATLVGNRTVLFRSGDKPDRLRGPNLGWFWLDEAAMCGPDVWRIMLGRLRVRPARAWATTTPRGKNWVHKVFVATDHPDFRHVRASSRTNPYLPTDFVPTLEDAYDAQFVAQEVEGEFLDDVLGRLIPDWQLDQVPLLVRPNKDGGPKWLTADLSEGNGGDPYCLLVGDDYGILYGEESAYVGPAEAAGRIRELSSEYNVRHERIVYDAGGGRGLDIEPYLERLGITEALGYKGPGKGGAKFENRRSRMAWAFRQRLDPDRPKAPPPLRHDEHRKPSVFDPDPIAQPYAKQAPFTIPPGWPLWSRFRQEAEALYYQHKGKKIALETKDDMKKRINRSPNIIDAMLMRFYLGDDDDS